MADRRLYKLYTPKEAHLGIGTAKRGIMKGESLLTVRQLN